MITILRGLPSIYCLYRRLGICCQFMVWHISLPRFTPQVLPLATIIYSEIFNNHLQGPASLALRRCTLFSNLNPIADLPEDLNPTRNVFSHKGNVQRHSGHWRIFRIDGSNWIEGFESTELRFVVSFYSVSFHHRSRGSIIVKTTLAPSAYEWSQCLST